MPRICLLALLVGVFVAPAHAQVPGNQNGKSLYHQTSPRTLFSFPNYFGAGNAAGDLIWKILPITSMKRASGSEEVSGLVVPVFTQNFTGGPLDVPDVEFRGTQRTSSGCTVPDVISPAYGRVQIGSLMLPAAGAYSISMTLSNTVTVPNGDLAVCYLAPEGESARTPDSARAFVAHGTRPDLGSCTGLSGLPGGLTGKYDARNGLTQVFAPADELALEVAFVEPTVQPVRNRRTENDLGQGAYEFAVGNGDNTLGWHVEAHQHIGQFVLPVFSFSGANGTISFFGVDACLTLDPFFDLLIVMLQVGPVVSDGGAGEQEDGVFDTFDFPIPTSVAGNSGSVAFFFLDLTQMAVVDATNTCTTTWR